MKNQFLVHLFVFFAAITMHAQDFQGKATYQSKTSSDISLEGRQLSEEQKRRIEQRLKSSLEKSYELVFDRTASLYSEEEKLDAPSTQSGRGGFRINFADIGEGIFYKNIQQKVYVNQKELFGKNFLIQDSLTPLEWKLGSETKTIGKYTCYKATAIVKIDTAMQRLQSFGRNRRGGPNRSQTETTQQDSTESSTNLARRVAQKERSVTAWYTPQIPVSQGPGMYWGLPGLILEINDGRTTILCNKITLNPEDKMVLEAPTKGKEVSQAEYNKMLSKKMTEMRESFRNERGGRGNGGRTRG